jgi:peptide/nickel transport system permease protein
MKSKTRTWVLIGLLVGLHAMILFAGLLNPYDPAAQNRDFPYAPPVRVHFVDARGFHLRLFVYLQAAGGDGYREDLRHAYPVHFLTRGSAYRILGVFNSNLHLLGVDEPARIFLLGTDAYGRDEFSRLLQGGQISLAAGLLATLLSLVAATVIGTISGYYGKWIDELLMGSAELLLSLPWLYFLLIVRALLPLHVSPTATFMLLIAVIGLIGWARPARLVRGIVLSARTHDYVLVARGFGGSDFYLLRRHILPQTFGVLLTQAALLVPQYVAAEVTLSFFGLGVSEPTPSWGNMLSVLQQYSVLVSYGWLLAPAVALVVTSVMYWLLADIIRDWLQSN